jgi:hypothetical protein
MSAIEQPGQAAKKEGRLIRVLHSAGMLVLLVVMLFWSGVLPILGLIYLWQRFSP